MIRPRPNARRLRRPHRPRRTAWRAYRVSLLPVALFVISGVAAFADDNAAGAGVTGPRGIINVPLEIAVLVTLLVALVASGAVIRHFGGSVLGRSFTYLLAGIALLGSTRVLYLMFELRLLQTGEITHNLWWHLLYYLAMWALLIALGSTIATIRATRFRRLGGPDAAFLALSAIAMVVLFVSAGPVDPGFGPWFEATWVDGFGLQHFVAFAFAGWLAVRLLWIWRNTAEEDLGSFMRAIIPSFFVLLALMSLNHLWELVTESWALVAVPTATVETVEQFFWLPAFGSIAYGLLRLRQTIARTVIQSAGEQALDAV